jgi:hypothetical protein
MPAKEQANLYATLTEINHFSDPSVEFTAQYTTNSPVLRDAGPPFNAVYLDRMRHRSPEGLQQMAARMANYVYHDLSTPLGSRLAQFRQLQQLNQRTPFRSFGTYTVWFPRGLLLRVAARQACQRLLENWQTANEDASWAQPITRACDQFFAEPCWKAEHIRSRIDQTASTGVDGAPGQALTAFLATLEAQADLSVARDDPAGWCRQALERVREWVGSGVSALEETSEWRKSRLHRLFATAVQKVADEYVELLSRPIQQMFDQPAYRLAAVETAYDHLIRRSEARVEEQQAAIREQARLTEKCWQYVDHAVDACIHPGSFLLFAGNRIRRLLRSFLERLTAYARQRLAEESVRSVQYFYTALLGRLNDLQRDLSFCRQRLRHVQENIMVPFAASAKIIGSTFELDLRGMPASGVSSSQLLGEAARILASRIVLPEGAKDLEVAADQFLQQLTPEHWYQLDQYLQEHILTPLRGLHQICITSSDLTRALGGPLLEGAAEYFAQLLPLTDVCEVEIAAAGKLHLDLPAQARAYHQLAVPSVTARHHEHEQAFALLPNSDAGKQMGEVIRQSLDHLNVVRVANQTDLLFCREQAEVGLEELQELLEPCKAAYLHAVTSPLTTPHARCDLLDWIPLDP